jgi:hypothetical protein
MCAGSIPHVDFAGWFVREHHGRAAGERDRETRAGGFAP